MLFKRCFFGDGAFSDLFLLDYPLLQPYQHVLAPFSLLQPTVHTFLVEVLLLEFYAFFLNLASPELLLDLIHPLLNLRQLIKMHGVVLQPEFPISGSQLLKFLLLLSNFQIEIVLDCKAPPIAVLNQHISIHTVHFNKLFSFLIRLIVCTVLGPHRVQHLRTALFNQQIVHQLRVACLMHLGKVVLRLHDSDGTLVLLEDRGGFVDLHFGDCSSRLVGQAFGFYVFEGVIVPEEILLIVEFVLPDTLNFVERVGLVLRHPLLFLGLLDLLLEQDVDLLEPILHKPEPVSLIPYVDQIFLALAQQLVAMQPRPREQLFVVGYFLAHLAVDGRCVFYLALHALVFLEELVQFGFQLGEVGLLLLRLRL